MNKVGPEFPFEQVQQIGIGNLAVVAAEVRSGSFTLDLDASKCGVTEEAIVARQR